MSERKNIRILIDAHIDSRDSMHCSFFFFREESLKKCSATKQTNGRAARRVTSFCLLAQSARAVSLKNASFFFPSRSR
jgi:hypothetical protein